jgi:hypothetical protein
LPSKSSAGDGPGAVGRGQANRDEIDTGIAQAEQEHRVAAEPVEPGDDQLGAVAAASIERYAASRLIDDAAVAVNHGRTMTNQTRFSYCLTGP